jgi:hypothetical protein
VGAQAPAFHNNNNKEKVMPKVGNKKFPYTAKGQGGRNGQGFASPQRNENLR